jgi:hypothetical protein
VRDDKRHEATERADEVEPASVHPDLHPHLLVNVCERCGSNDSVRKGLCHGCREILRGERKVMESEHTEKPHQAQPEPLHSPPWRRRGA